MGASRKCRRRVSIIDVKLSDTMLSRTLHFALFLILVTVAALGGAQAEDPRPMGTFKDWHAYKMTQAGKIACFAVSSPEERLPANVNHGNVFFIVTNWVTDDTNGEPSVVTGYSFKEDSTVTLEVGSAKWSMFTDQKGAWLRTTDEEKALITAMKSGSSMRVKGTSARGTATEYRVSLAGITAAIKEIDTNCK